MHIMPPPPWAAIHNRPIRPSCHAHIRVITLAIFPCTLYAHTSHATVLSGCFSFYFLFLIFVFSVCTLGTTCSALSLIPALMVGRLFMDNSETVDIRNRMAFDYTDLFYMALGMVIGFGRFVARMVKSVVFNTVYLPRLDVCIFPGGM
jgi:hypothetical protein